MARHRRPYPYHDEIDPLKALAGLIVLAVGGFIVTYRQQIILYGIVAIVVLAAVLVGLLLWQRSRKAAALNLDDEKILYMLKGMTPSVFEQEMANMFTALGYRCELTGGAGDGGIDIVAVKNGKKYFIQCKKFITREVTPHDVRDFLGAITNINNPAEKGYFITTNKFTLAAERAAEGNPRIELIDGLRLIEYYKMAQGKMPAAAQIPEPNIPEPQPPAPPAITRTCPLCGGELAIRTAHKGEHTGHRFWGCSRYPKCKFLENIHDEVAVH